MLELKINRNFLKTKAYGMVKKVAGGASGNHQKYTDPIVDTILSSIKKESKHFSINLNINDADEPVVQSGHPIDKKEAADSKRKKVISSLFHMHDGQ